MRAAGIKMQSHRRLTFLHSNSQPFLSAPFSPLRSRPISLRRAAAIHLSRERTILSGSGVFAPEISCQSVGRAAQEKKNSLARFSFTENARERERERREKRSIPESERGKPCADNPHRITDTMLLLYRNKFYPSIPFTSSWFTRARYVYKKNI